MASPLVPADRPFAVLSLSKANRVRKVDLDREMSCGWPDETRAAFTIALDKAIPAVWRPRVVVQGPNLALGGAYLTSDDESCGCMVFHTALSPRLLSGPYQLGNQADRFRELIVPSFAHHTPLTSDELTDFLYATIPHAITALIGLPVLPSDGTWAARHLGRDLSCWVREIRLDRGR